MNARELMIGNYLQGKDIVKVKAISNNEFVRIEGNPSYFKVGLGEDCCLRPIPITEDWLEKLGFEKKSEDVYKLYSGPIEFEWICEESLYFEGISIDVDFIHELQNLHYALTFEHLKIEQ